MEGLPAVILWSLAVLPIALLVVLVARGRLGSGTYAALAVVAALITGAVAFGAGPDVLGFATAKGLWVGVWILYVVWPALLLYQVCARGGLDRMGHVFSSVLPTKVENILLVAWVFPSFVQGVAGFGTPIAVAAPLLVSMGVPKVRAVVLPLVGYHWSVTFGSMGSSFYMGSLTARLNQNATSMYAAESAFLLGVNLIAAGVLVALLYGGRRALRHAVPMLLVVGTTMFVVLQVAARIEPSITSLAAGVAGLAAVAVLRTLRRGGDRDEPTSAVDHHATSEATTGAARPDPGSRPFAPPVVADQEPPRRPLVVLLPYLYLLVAVLAVMIPAPVREFARSRLLLGFNFPATETSLGFQNAAIDTYTPIALLSHPGSFVLLASLLGILTYRLTGLWPQGALRPTLRRWVGGLGRPSLSILALATLATILVDTGMVATIASGAAHATGAFFPLISPVIGALGSFTTGSSTTSNALFAALQADVATRIDVDTAHLVAAQTAGSNVGNSLAPVIIIIGATAAGIPHLERDIFRQVAGPAVLLLGLTTIMVGLGPVLL